MSRVFTIKPAYLPRYCADAGKQWNLVRCVVTEFTIVAVLAIVRLAFEFSPICHVRPQVPESGSSRARDIGMKSIGIAERLLQNTTQYNHHAWRSVVKPWCPVVSYSNKPPNIVTNMVPSKASACLLGRHDASWSHNGILTSHPSPQSALDLCS